MAQVDPGNTVAEASKADNRTQLGVTVRPAVVPVELLVNVSDVVATPARPDKLPSTIAVSALVSNIGRTDALNVRVVLRESAAPDAAILDEKIVNLLGRTRQVVNFAATLTRPGKQTYVVVIDPDAHVVESDKTNNSAAVSVETVASLDVEVREGETVIARNPVFLGADAAFHTTIRNSGTQGTPPFGVRYSVTNGTRTVVVGERVIQLSAGAKLEQDIAWRADMAGALQLRVDLDPDTILAETDKANNRAVLPFTVVDVSGPNLSLSYKDFSTEPAVVTEGLPVTLSQLVHNSGSVTLTNVEVAFYDGDPAGKRLIGQLQVIPSIAPGATVKVSTVWAPYPDAFDHLVFVVADPARQSGRRGSGRQRRLRGAQCAIDDRPGRGHDGGHAGTAETVGQHQRNGRRDQSGQTSCQQYRGPRLRGRSEAGRGASGRRPDHRQPRRTGHAEPDLRLSGRQQQRQPQPRDRGRSGQCDRRKEQGQQRRAPRADGAGRQLRRVEPLLLAERRRHQRQHHARSPSCASGRHHRQRGGPQRQATSVFSGAKLQERHWRHRGVGWPEPARHRCRRRRLHAARDRHQRQAAGPERGHGRYQPLLAPARGRYRVRPVLEYVVPDGQAVQNRTTHRA
ncbi:hypothetical protein LP419_39195 [Massilia sp. H-1]|nr:hypothetical protein LP419_39195 [Massilia sp. H-1]